MATFTSNYAWTKPAGSDPVDIGVLNNNLDSQDGIMHDAFLNMADPFSESSTYAVGNIVVYGTKTYKCHTAVTTAGSWTGATNWDEYKLSEGGLVAGDYINIQNGVVNVQTEIGTYDYVRYELESTGGGAIKLIVRKYVNNVLDSTTEYPNDGQHHEIDDVMDTWYEYGPYLWHYKLLVASTDHAVGYEESWSYQDTSVHTVNFQFAQDDSTTLVTKGDLDDALDDKVDKVTGKGLSTNDYTNTDKAEVAKVANKADKTATASGETLALVPTSEGRALLHTAYGMSTQSGTPTPSSPVDIESAKADFRSVGKNILPYPYPGNPVGNLTIIDNGDGSITLNGTASEYGGYVFLESRRTLTPLIDVIALKEGSRYNINFDIVSGSIDRHNNRCTVAFRQYIQNATNPNRLTYENDVFDADASGSFTFSTADGYIYGIIYLEYVAGVEFKNCRIRPMITLADVTDSTYEPYTKHDTTTDLTLRAIEVTSSDNYNLVRDGKYYVADTLDYSEDNGWSVTRRIKHLGVESTTDTGKLFIDSSGKFFVYRLPTDAVVSAEYVFSTGWAKTISNRFTESVISSSTASPVGKGGIIANNNYCRIGIDSTIATDIAGVRTWLTNNPTYIEYILATPTTENITTAQALALLGLKTYDESTTISSQAEPACTIAVEYAQERLGALALTAYNTAKGNDLRITALEG